MPALTNLEAVFPRVQKPARYTGGEWNSIVKDWDACDLRAVFAYPDLYDIGMSNLGLGILYDVVNRQGGMLAERVFAPWADMEAIMRAEGIPLWSLESRHPLAEFDLIGFSLSYEGTYTNILNMLDLAGLPVRAEDRDERYPLVICGGSGALNPDALAITVEDFRARLFKSRRAIKPALLDQRAVAGIGNLYASEMLFAARIDPRRRCTALKLAEWQLLHAEMLRILNEAVKYEGSTLGDGTYRNALNEAGGYQNHHRVYDREGENCPSCHKTPVKRIVQTQRATFFCPTCQGKKRS